VADPALNQFYGPAAVAFEPVAVEGFGHDPKLDNQVAGEVLGLDFTPFLAPEAQ